VLGRWHAKRRRCGSEPSGMVVFHSSTFPVGRDILFMATPSALLPSKSIVMAAPRRLTVSPLLPSLQCRSIGQRGNGFGRGYLEERSAAMGRFLTAVMLMACLWVGQALADEVQFSLINNTGRDITHVYVTAPGDGVWSYDLLSASALYPGRETQIIVPDLRGCRANIRVRYTDERLGYLSGVDVCRGGTVSIGNRFQ